jgi:ribonuclease HI
MFEPYTAPAVAKVLVYTDGSSTGRVGAGGWSFVVVDPFTDTELYRRSGRATKTTNNRMELAGAIAALTVLPVQQAATIVSDSQCVCYGYTDWFPKWKAQNWRNGAIANLDLWQRLDALVKCRTASTSFLWVRGHASSKWNNLVDTLAVKARTQDED